MAFEAAVSARASTALTMHARLADFDLTCRPWAQQTRTTSASWRSCGSTLSGELGQPERHAGVSDRQQCCFPQGTEHCSVRQGTAGIEIKVSL